MVIKLIITKSYAQKIDLNKATASQLQKVLWCRGKIIRTNYKIQKICGGFIADVQLQEVYGLTPEVIER